MLERTWPAEGGLGFRARFRVLGLGLVRLSGCRGFGA